MSAIEKRLDALAKAIEQECGNTVATVDVDNGERSHICPQIFVRMETKLHNAGDVFAIAYDHGFVPVGPTERAFRLQPRDTDELRV